MKEVEDLSVGDSILERGGLVAALGELDAEGESEEAVRFENPESAVGKALPRGAVETKAAGETIRTAFG